MKGLPGNRWSSKVRSFFFFNFCSVLLTVSSSKEDMLDGGSWEKKNSFSAEEVDEDLSKMEDCRPVWFRMNPLTEIKSDFYSREKKKHAVVMLLLSFFRKNPNSEASFPPHANRRPAATQASELPSTHPL